MVPTTVIVNSITDQVAADVALLAAAAAKHVHLIMAPFVPSRTTDFPALTEATFTGGGALNAAAGAQQSFNDASTGLRVVQLIEPLGGWHWHATANTNLPQTIYGYCVTDLADAVTFGSALLPAPVVLNAIGDSIDLPNVRLTSVVNPLS